MQANAMWTLYFDGGCNLCDVGKTRAERWAARAGQPFRAVPLQTEEAVMKGYGDAMVLEAEGRVLQAADAWVELLRIAPPWWKPLYWFSRVPGGRWVITTVYNWIARNRIKWFGVKACPLPSRPVGQPSNPSSEASTSPAANASGSGTIGGSKRV